MVEPKSFGAEWDEEMELRVASLEDEAMSRAFDRNDKHSHLLIIFMLKALKPEKYRDNMKPEPVAPKQEPMSDELLVQLLGTLPPEMLAQASAPKRWEAPTPTPVAIESSPP